MADAHFHVNWKHVCTHCYIPLDVYIVFDNLEFWCLLLLFTAAFPLDLRNNRTIYKMKNERRTTPLCKKCYNSLHHQNKMIYIFDREIHNNTNIDSYMYYPKGFTKYELLNYLEHFNRYLKRRDSIYWESFFEKEYVLLNLRIIIQMRDNYTFVIDPDL